MSVLLDLTSSEFYPLRDEYCKEELKLLCRCTEPEGSPNKELFKQAFKNKELEFIKAHTIKRTNEEDFYEM